MTTRIAIAAFMSACVWSSAAAAQNLPRPLQNVGFDQRLNEQVPLDLEFADEAGKPVKLGDYFHGKPVILVLAYYRCPMLCTLVLNGLVQGMLDMDFTVGKEFEVVTVSFDPRETPELAAEKKKNYVARYGRPGAREGWHFLTGKDSAIRRLTQAVGFRYQYDAEADQFAHASGITLLSPTGKISRYFYDIRYAGRDLRLGLVEASAGKVGSAADQVLLFCFHYDPTVGKYGLAVINFIRLGGALTLLTLLSAIFWMRRRERRRLHCDVAGTPASDRLSFGVSSPAPLAELSTPQRPR